MQHEGDSDTVVISPFGTILKRIGKENRSLGNKRINREYQECSIIIKISQNTEKSPGDSNSSVKPSANAGVKNSQKSNENDMYKTESVQENATHKIL